MWLNGHITLWVEPHNSTSPPYQVWWPQTETLGSEDVKVLVYHMILQNHMIKELLDFMGQNLLC